jgi:hypothetical protein
MDILVAQFGTRAFLLRNETVGGVTKLVEKTPPQVPTGGAFRARAMDANGDGTMDFVIGRTAANAGFSLIISNVAETEPNESIGQATAVNTFPALVTGVVSAASDKDVMALPTRAVNEGTRIRLVPAAGVDLRFHVLDEAGNVLSTAQAGGTGAIETLDLNAGTLGRFIQVELQGTLLGSGIYRLEIDVRP